MGLVFSFPFNTLSDTRLLSLMYKYTGESTSKYMKDCVYLIQDSNNPIAFEPEGTIEINTNGVHDVSAYAEASVNIPSSNEQLEEIKATLIEKGVATEETDSTELNGVIQEQSFMKTYLTNVGAYGLFAFYGCSWSWYSSSNSVQKPSYYVELPVVFQEHDTENCTTFANMFYYTKVKSIPYFNTANALNYSSMFYECESESKIKDFSIFNFDKVTNVGNMFYNSSVLDDSIENVSIRMPWVVQLSMMFCRANCGIKHIDLETGIEQHSYMCYSDIFNGMKSLESIYWKFINDTPYNKTNEGFVLASTFSGCTNLQTAVIDLNNLIKFTHLGSSSCNSTFRNCTNLQHVEIKNAYISQSKFAYESGISAINNMFNGCSLIEELPPLSIYQVTSNYYASDVVKNCTNLKVVNFKNIRVDLQLASGDTYGHLLTVDSLVNTCKECIADTKSHTLTIGNVNIDKLANVYVRLTDEPEEYSAFSKKPCEVCEATDEGAMTITDYMALKRWNIQ